MAIIQTAKSIVGDQCRRKLGKPGTPDPKNIQGIYQVRTRSGKQKVVKMKFYAPTNPRTELQQANRTKFANAVANWQSLTEDEKKVYNKEAKCRRMSGFNLYIRQYMLS